MVVGYLVLIEVGKRIFYRAAATTPGRAGPTTAPAPCAAAPPASAPPTRSAPTLPRPTRSPGDPHDRAPTDNPATNDQQVEITDDGHTLAAAEVSTPPIRTAPPTSYSTPNPDTSPPAPAAHLVDAVLDLPDVQRSDHLHGLRTDRRHESMGRLGNAPPTCGPTPPDAPRSSTPTSPHPATALGGWSRYDQPSAHPAAKPDLTNATDLALLGCLLAGGELPLGRADPSVGQPAAVRSRCYRSTSSRGCSGSGEPPRAEPPCRLSPDRDGQGDPLCRTGTLRISTNDKPDSG